MTLSDDEESPFQDDENASSADLDSDIHLLSFSDDDAPHLEVIRTPNGLIGFDTPFSIEMEIDLLSHIPQVLCDIPDPPFDPIQADTSHNVNDIATHIHHDSLQDDLIAQPTQDIGLPLSHDDILQSLSEIPIRYSLLPDLRQITTSFGPPCDEDDSIYMGSDDSLLRDIPIISKAFPEFTNEMGTFEDHEDNIILTDDISELSFVSQRPQEQAVLESIEVLTAPGPPLSYSDDIDQIQEDQICSQVKLNSILAIL
ncbi:hypothetical protein ADUPG1_013723 [Aduncisulcus paluster]|uniref:Uncharacterized protein n=1 Tax=Aduncisulcus paluster TaxID=2918883 RepID=A0ABQ5K5R0_9EUKA|nr:hypothetical protein ADUPG1_013723 [Aduncisulcus paluster]